jgi:hypothetical protein
MEHKRPEQIAPASELDAPSPASGPRVQLRRAMAAMTYAEQVEAVRPPAPGARAPQVQARVERSQLQAEGGRVDTDSVHAAAAEGTRGSGGPLPYLGTVQHAFGSAVDLSGVRAHSDGPAHEANVRMGSSAYAYGNEVAFKGAAPSLHTVAHEAAHVVQQRAGVQLPGGVGRPGDAYERQADAIAERVVQGRSAKDLIAKAAGIDLSAPTVQHQVQYEDGPTKQEMVDFIAGKVANPSDSTLRQTYEDGVRALAGNADAGVQKLGISLEAFNQAKLANNKGAVALPTADDEKLGSLAQEMVAARLQLSTDTKHLTLRPLLHYIFIQNQARYPSKYGPTYEFLRAEGKTNAQVIGGSCRPNPDINAFLANFKSWLTGLAEDTVRGYYADAQNNTLGE